MFGTAKGTSQKPPFGREKSIQYNVLGKRSDSEVRDSVPSLAGCVNLYKLLKFLVFLSKKWEQDLNENIHIDGKQ